MKTTRKRRETDDIHPGTGYCTECPCSPVLLRNRAEMKALVYWRHRETNRKTNKTTLQASGGTQLSVICAPESPCN
ncbi:hypothetical protein GJAV_G00242110 [Gymnothorax javanicus]|nr:hypothetical protein GJAV_G00242110 [Gymnothorax javanicus]